MNSTRRLDPAGLDKLDPAGQFMEATSTVSVPPSGWRNKAVSTDFHALRQDFSPTDVI